jgi:hypothetical protein
MTETVLKIVDGFLFGVGFFLALLILAWLGLKPV